MVASPRVRAGAARGWGAAAAGGKRWAEAVAGFTAAVELVGQVAPRGLARSDQEHRVGELAGLGADAAACCVQAGLPGRAVELFEQGRGVLLGQALDTRTDLTALSEQYPAVAGRFTALRDELDRADDPAGHAAAPFTTTGDSGGGGGGASGDSAARRSDTATGFERLIDDIRQLPGFARFLRPVPVEELQAAAGPDPVVLVVVSRFGSYALIMTATGVPQPLPLPDLTPDAVYTQVVEFLDALAAAGEATAASQREAAEGRLGGILGWLWDTLAGPVLDRLGITGPPGKGQRWPRLWWCTSGVLSFLPLHAAGHHDTRTDPTPATVIDRVVCSYTPTVRALAHARRPRPGAGDDGDGSPAQPGGQVLVVAMPRTPGASALPGAAAETALVRALFPGRVRVLAGEALTGHPIPPPTDEATHDGVLAALRDGRWAHFACHGAVDLADPSASRLLLTDHRSRPLTVTDVARLRLDDAELAFLSACSTAQPGDRLSDEAIHLASAFQLAGYRHVVATLWPIGDRHAVNITNTIYTALLADAGNADGAGDVAGAVHTATRRLREAWPDDPSVWASHLHSGA